MARPKRSYTTEFRQRAIELVLYAIIWGWSVKRFSRIAKIPKVTLLTWLSDDLVFDRYKRAQEIKALDLPSMAMEIVHEMRKGDLDSAIGSRILKHLEFRMMREIKAIYRTETQVNHKHSLEDMSDSEVDAKFEELLARAKAQKKDPDDAGPSVH